MQDKATVSQEMQNLEEIGYFRRKRRSLAAGVLEKLGDKEQREEKTESRVGEEKPRHQAFNKTQFYFIPI